MPARASIQISRQGIDAVDERRIKNGWSWRSLAFAQAAGVGESTLRHFWEGKRLRKESLMGIFEAVEIKDWQQYIESEQVMPERPLAADPAAQRIDDGVPERHLFYGRSQELHQLVQWVCDHRYRVIALLGMGGIGKTALTLKLVEQLLASAAAPFEGVIWRSMRSAPALSEFLTDLLETFTTVTPESNNRQRLIGELIKHLQQRRLLLVLDGWEELLGGEYAGAYRAEYKDYNILLAELKQRPSESCVILTSREKQADMTIMGSIRSYVVPGLEPVDAFQLLSQKGLFFNPDEGKQLVQLYRGNPLALSLVASVIRDHFDYSIGSFLHQRTVLVDESMQTILDQQTCNLRETERQTLCALAQDPEPIDRAALQARFAVAISTSDLVSALASLERRSLIERSTELGQTLYTLQPVVRKYMQRSLGCSQ
jgi:NB-ARC domain